MSDKLKDPPEHHKQSEFCLTRPEYRRGRKLRAVKAFTISTESQHLLIYNVPKVNLRTELKAICQRFGPIKKLHIVPDIKTEKFTECYHLCYGNVTLSKHAKKALDNRAFFGNILHVCYGPEYESLEETEEKLNERDRLVKKQIKKNTIEYQHIKNHLNIDY